MEWTDVTAAAVTAPPPTLEQLEAAEQDLVTEIDQQRQKAYDEIFRDTELARDPTVIRERYRWIGYEIACLGKEKFQQILATPFSEMHLQGIFPGADRIWQLLYARVTATPETSVTPPELLRVTDLHQGFAPPNSNRGDNFFGVSYEMVLLGGGGGRDTSPGTTESFLQPKPLHQYWVKCDFAPEFFRGCWLPELLMRTHPPYIKELNRIRRLAIEDLTQDALNACNKRLSLMGSAVVAAIPMEKVAGTPSEEKLKAFNSGTPRPDPIKIATQLWENPKLTEIHIRVLRRICGNIVQCLLRGNNNRDLTEAQLFETLDGDPAVVIGSFLVTMQLKERSPAVIKQVIDRKLSLGTPGSLFQYQPGFRCLVAGFPRAVWLPVSLFAWVAARECGCGIPETCHCKWRNIYAGYDFVDRLLRG